MPHELRGLQDQPHEFFTHVLTGGGLIGLLIVGFVGHLLWRDRRRPKRPVVILTKQSDTASLEGTLTMPVDQHCWMWEQGQHAGCNRYRLAARMR